MAYINDFVLDAALASWSAVDLLTICSQQPATLTEATSTYALGSKSSPSIGSVGDASPNGRKRTVAAITDGSITGNGTATHYAHVDAGTALIGAAALSASQAVTSGNTFSLGAHDIRFPDAA